MIYNSKLRKFFTQYHSSIILKFCEEFPLPDIKLYRYYPIVSEDRQKLVVWGKNSREITHKFIEFLELAMFR
jgi:hypothetical protein